MTSLAESEWARRARHFCALERRLFELLGGWVPSVPEPGVKILLRTHSFQHAWHSELWTGLVPVGEDPVGATVRPAVRAVLDGVGEAAGTAERLVGAYRLLLPQLVSTYAALLERLDEAAGGPEGRVLKLVLADDREACRAADALLEGLSVGPEAGRGVEAALVAAAGVDVIERPRQATEVELARRS